MALLISVQLCLVFREQIFSPIDELQHTDYVRTVAVNGELPVFGEKQTDLGLIGLYFHEYPKPPTSEQLARVGPAGRSSYEALQFPVYYLVSAPLYKVLAADPPAAVYGLRILDVVFSAIWLILLILTVRAVGVRPTTAAAISLALALIPGVALRNSQVINEVLCGVFVAALFYLLIEREPRWRNGQTFAEGVLVGVATLTKLTAVALIPIVVLVWLTRGRPRGSSMVSGFTGLIVSIAPWLAWAIPVYGFPVPFLARHPPIFDPASFWLPHGLHAWIGYLQQMIRYFWFPWEWRFPASWAWVDAAVLVMASLVLLASTALAILLAWRRGGWQTTANRAVLLAGSSLICFVACYVVFIIGLNRIWETDFRELYIFFPPLAICLGYIAVRLGQRVTVAIASGAVVLWLAADVGFFVLGTCPRCYP